IDIAERTYNKLARTRLAQRQALEPDRTGNTSNLTVVSVSDGSQAIVGVTQATREPRSDNPTPPTAEKGVAPSASRPDTQKTLMPPAEKGTAISQTGARRRNESDGQ